MDRLPQQPQNSMLRRAFVGLLLKGGIAAALVAWCRPSGDPDAKARLVPQSTPTPHPFTNLADLGMIDDALGRLLAEAVARSDSVLITGATGVGKTTVLNSLVDAPAEGARIAAFDDAWRPLHAGLEPRATQAGSHAHATVATLTANTPGEALAHLRRAAAQSPQALAGAAIDAPIGTPVDLIVHLERDWPAHRRVVASAHAVERQGMGHELRRIWPDA